MSELQNKLTERLNEAEWKPYRVIGVVLDLLLEAAEKRRRGYDKIGSEEAVALSDLKRICAELKGEV